MLRVGACAELPGHHENYSTSKTDVALWCYKWIGYEWMVTRPGGVRYRAPYSFDNVEPSRTQYRCNGFLFLVPHIRSHSVGWSMSKS